MNGYGFSTFGYPAKGSPTARFYAQFRKRFEPSPDSTYPALGYDTIKVLEAAVIRAGSRAVCERLQAVSGYEVEPWKPLVGENLFTRESGAVASQFHEPPAIEPYSSDVVGASRRIVLGNKSGLDSIPDQARRARPRRAGQGAAGAPRAGEGARRARAAARDGRRVPGARFRCQASVTERAQKARVTEGARG